MLGFVVPLKSRQVSRDWEHVRRLIERTLRSACGQTHPDFHIVVACHDVPRLGFEHPNLEFHSVDFDPPSQDYKARRRDKRRKLYAALQRIRRTGPSHIMVLDSDDLVSRQLARLIADSPDSNGWYLRSGYMYSCESSTLHVERWRFHKWCGSSHIWKLGNIELGTSSAQREWTLSHRFAVEQQKKRGTPLKPLPFRGAVYTVSHGENFHDYAPILWPRDPLRRLARRFLFHRPITKQIREEFGLYPIARRGPRVSPTSSSSQ